MSDYFLRNRNCSCTRCRTRGLLGPAILITLGVLLLLQAYIHIPFDRTWPVLLVVIGVFLLINRTASSEGHVQPYWPGGPAAPASSQDRWAGGRVPPAPSEPASGEQPGQQQNDTQVKS
jgi:hypothetical protein